MGNLNTIQGSPQPVQTQIPKTPNKGVESPNETKTEVKTDDNEIFSKILDISNDLLMEYNNEFLKDDFCNKLSMIFEKKISNFSIKVLKSLYNNINSNKVDNELIVTLQYIPQNDEKFTDFTDFFKDNLNENFWKKNIQLNNEKLSQDGFELKKNNIVSFVKSLPYYINSRHVNNLLNTKESININITKIGGFIKSNNKLIKKFSKKNKLTKKSGKKNKLTKKVTKKNELTKKGGNSNKNRKNDEENEEENDEENEEENEEENDEENNEENNEENQEENKNYQSILNTYFENSNNKKKSKINENMYNKKKNEINENIIKNNINKINNNLIKNENHEYTKNENHEYTKKELNKKMNSIILKNSNIPVKNIPKKDEEEEDYVKEFIKYSVPKKYTEPKKFCNNTEKCQLTKKELCEAICENFIVRNNIIAAILTTIPFKNENGEYEGGICYKKFLNLGSCRVCVPYDYRSLKDKDMNYIIQQITEKADDLDENECRKNQGFFLKLTEKEKNILEQKALNANKESIEKNPKLKYNLFWVQFTRKLKKTYFDNLNSLIMILEKMKSTPLINNKTLNLLSLETKNIIDNMYNLCHYYYVYAIISLINADITEEVIKEDKLESFVSKALENKNN